MQYDFAKKRIAVVGMARSGLAAADVLARRGADVTLIDGKAAAELGDALAYARECGIAALTETERVGDVDLVVTSPGVPKSAPVLQDAVVRNIPIWGEIEAAFRISHAPILAITGTNGKTTTTALLGAMTEQAGIKTYVAGNIAAGPIALPLIRAADQAAASDVIVAEISSFQLEWIDTFQPKVAALLNISTDHSDRQSWEDYLASKWRIFENLTQGDTAVLRSDVPRPINAAPPNAETVYFDRLPVPEWMSEITLPGAHNIENVMAARAMASAFGIGESAIHAAAVAFAGVVHRLEHVAEIDGVRWINNSMCTNNDAFARSLAAIDSPKIVLAGGVYKGGDTDQFAKAAASASVRALIFFGKSGALLSEAAKQAGAVQTEVVETLADAVRAARALAKSGDVVMLSPACASFDQFKNFEDRGDQFKALVRTMVFCSKPVRNNDHKP